MDLGENLKLAEIEVIEQMALRAWPGLEVHECDGWLLRYATGITRRANSVWPNNTDNDMDLNSKLEFVERYYHTRGLPARFQICPAAQPSDLDEVLDRKGYLAVARTAVQTASVDDLTMNIDAPMSMPVHVDRQPSPSWWTCYANADDVERDALQTRMAICAGIKLPTAYASVSLEGEAIAVGSASFADGWMGVFNVATLPSHRRKGAARAVMSALIAWGSTIGATHAYLQVMANNDGALRLYETMGFTTGYYYHYREEAR